jgi:CRISPR/Cas system-associated exonuclease Cas4 (RecB family)
MSKSQTPVGERPVFCSATDVDLTDTFISEIGSLPEQYDRYLVAAQSTADELSKRAPGIHASEISKCYRKAVYTMRGEEKREEGNLQERARWQRTFAQGHAIHRMIQSHFTNMAELSKRTLLFTDEVPISPDKQALAAKWSIHSSCDGIFTFQERDASTWNYNPYIRVGLEIKSANANQFEALREPKPEHIEQVHVYMAVLDLPVTWVLYYNKNNQNITPATTPWLVRFNAKLWAKLESRFASWHEHLNAGTLPDAMPGSHCGFCPYTWTCSAKKPKSRFSDSKRTPTSAGLRKLTTL